MMFILSLLDIIQLRQDSKTSNLCPERKPEP